MTYYIHDIHQRERGSLGVVTYAHLSDEDGQLVIAATLEYVLKAIRERGYEVKNWLAAWLEREGV